MTKRRVDYRHILCLLATLGFIVCGVFLFPNSLFRLIESVRDFGLSCAYYFCKLFGIENNITPTVTELSEYITAVAFFPEDWTGVKSAWTAYWRVWLSVDNLNRYLVFLSGVLLNISRCMVIALSLILGVYVYFKMYLKTENNHYDKDSKSLKTVKWISAHFYRPIRAWMASVWGFIKERRYYRRFWLALWLLYFNVYAIFLEFVAYYLYFMSSFEVTTLFRQFYKLFIDLSVAIDFLPIWAWVPLILFFFDYSRKRIAYMRLRHFERRNCGFINARPIVYMVCGTMGTKKTTAITDMALSQEVLFRDKAFEKILENDLKFPFFPWINLENEVKRAMEYHEVYNLATIRKFIQKKAKRWERRPCREKIFNYDYERYGLTYNDQLKTVDVWEVIETYAQLYFIYIVESSLIISNYSIRTDMVLSDLGNFPLWNGEFFQKDSRLIGSYSRHSHILDFDSLRLGRKVIEENPNADGFEFGIVVITEVGKERGNMLELNEKKKKDENTNQKNDLFNAWLKMVRHSATVDNFPFVKVITDEQRPESWGADARDLCEIVHIQDSGNTNLAMPFFSLAELLYGWLFSKFADLYYRYRYVRSDNTLPMYALKALTAKIQHYYTGIYNRFGYCTLRVTVENGTQKGKAKKNKYYLMSKKIYSKRFSTDCFSDFFTEKALRSKVGIEDLKEYKTEKATFEELQLQHSYFIDELLNGLR